MWRKTEVACNLIYDRLRLELEDGDRILAGASLAFPWVMLVLRRPTRHGQRRLVAVYWLDLGTAGFFATIAVGFCLYAALLVHAVVRVKPSTVAG